jgi:hypothetical protein
MSQHAQVLIQLSQRYGLLTLQGIGQEECIYLAPQDQILFPRKTCSYSVCTRHVADVFEVVESKGCSCRLGAHIIAI